MILTAAICLVTVPDVLDVGSGPGAYLEIQAAVQAAVDGDVIRVAPGTYGSFAVRGKDVTILGGPGVTVEGVVRVQELTATQSVSVHGLTLRLAPDQSESRLILGYNQGPVRFEDVFVPGLGSDHYSLFAPGVRTLHCRDVTFSRCQFEPMTAWDDWFNRFYGAPGLICLSSDVSLFDCEVNGYGSEAPHAIVAGGSVVELQGSTVRGGWGGSNYLTFAGNCRGISGVGGDGVIATHSTIVTVDSSVTGGGGGFDECWGGGSLPPGIGIRLAGSSTLVEGPGIAPLLEVPDQVTEGAPFTATVTTEPADLVLLLVSGGSDRLLIPGLFGSLLVESGPGYRRIFPGQSGSFQVPFTAPSLPMGATLKLHFQVTCLRPDPAMPTGSVAVLGATEVITVLDSVF